MVFLWNLCSLCDSAVKGLEIVHRRVAESAEASAENLSMLTSLWSTSKA